MDEKVSIINNQVDKKVNKDIDNYLYTVGDIGKMIDESVNVIRNWLRLLSNHIDTKKNANGYNMFNDKGLERMREIKVLHREQNFSIKQVNHYFNTGGEDFIPPTSEEYIEQENDDIDELKEMMKSLIEKSEKQEEFNKKLLEEFDKRERFFKDELEKRDKLLLENVNEDADKNKEDIEKEPEAVKEETIKIGFWSKLFGR